MVSAFFRSADWQIRWRYPRRLQSFEPDHARAYPRLGRQGDQGARIADRRRQAGLLPRAAGDRMVHREQQHGGCTARRAYQSSSQTLLARLLWSTRSRRRSTRSSSSCPSCQLRTGYREFALSTSPLHRRFERRCGSPFEDSRIVFDAARNTTIGFDPRGLQSPSCWGCWERCRPPIFWHQLP